MGSWNGSHLGAGGRLDGEALRVSWVVGGCGWAVGDRRCRLTTGGASRLGNVRGLLVVFR